MSNRFETLQLNPTDLLADEKFASLNCEQRGIWLNLMFFYWNNGSLPDDNKQLAKLCQCYACALHEHWASYACWFPENPMQPGSLSCPFLDSMKQNLEEAKKRKNAKAKKAANARWEKTRTNEGRPPNNPAAVTLHNAVGVKRGITPVKTSEHEVGNSIKGNYLDQSISTTDEDSLPFAEPFIIVKR